MSRYTEDLDKLRRHYIVGTEEALLRGDYSEVAKKAKLVCKVEAEIEDRIREGL